jgi:outer membrane protein assembly factor BamD
MTIKTPAFKTAAVALVALMLVACASTKDETDSANIDRLYADAREELSAGNYEQAIKALEKVEARATGTLAGQQALLDMAYAHWRSGERALALSVLDRFKRLHPSSPAADYALYLRGLVNFNDGLGLFGNLARQNVAERDQQASRDAWQAFSQLIQQYPQSRYAEDARVRMDYIVNSLAEYEVHVARYYFRRGAYVAAANRAKQAVTLYERAPAVEEALALMVDSYDRLGMQDLRDDAQRVLTKNFPSSRLASRVAGSSPGTGSGATDLERPARPWWRFW